MISGPTCATDPVDTTPDEVWSDAENDFWTHYYNYQCRVDELEQQRAQIQTQVGLAREELSKAAFAALRKAEAGARLQLAKDIYYLCDEVPASIVEQGLCLTTGPGVRSAIGPYEMSSTCPQCHLSFNLLLNSRAALTRYQAHPSASHLCPSCEKNRHTRSKATWEAAAEKERAARLALAALPYAEYLHTEWWQAQRQAALKRARYRCQLCNGTTHLNVHHRTYERIGNELASDLIVLCNSCHGKFHEVK